MYGGGEEVGEKVSENRSGSPTMTRFSRIHPNLWRGTYALRRSTPWTPIVPWVDTRRPVGRDRDSSQLNAPMRSPIGDRAGLSRESDGLRSPVVLLQPETGRFGPGLGQWTKPRSPCRSGPYPARLGSDAICGRCERCQHKFPTSPQ